MKAEQQICFLADLLNLINELDTLVKDHCWLRHCRSRRFMSGENRIDEEPF